MKKSYKFAFSPLIIVIAVILNVLLCVVVVLNSLKLGKVGTFDSVNRALDASAIALAIVLGIVVNIFMFASKYTLYNKYLQYNLGFIRYKIRYADMVVIREEKNTHALVVSYKKIMPDKDGVEQCYVSGIVINISNSKKEDFVEQLREKNHSLEYQIIDKELD